MIPDTTGVAPGWTKTYPFIASRPGTYLYEAGLVPNAQHQVALGLYGALIVQSATAGQAYDSASTAFDDEALLVLSELDPALNNSANPAAFDMRYYHPTYALINGQAYPNTTAIESLAGNKVLLRYVNAGLQAHSMSALGLRQTAIAMDGSAYEYAHGMVAETIAPGQTADAIVTVPASAVDGTKYALYDGTFAMHNGSAAGFGGMLTFISIGTAMPGADTTGPATMNVALSPNQVSGSIGVDINASVSDVASGDSGVSAAEYYIDTTSGTGTAMSITGGPATYAASATIPAGTVNALSTGSHTIYVRGQDSVGNWGAFSSAILMVDNTGPASTGLTLTPNPSNGTADVALHATANDSASGGSNIFAAEYTIDGGGPTSMSVSAAAPIASLSATIPAATVNALTEGSHTVAVRSQDALGNWGTPATISLIVDRTGPTTSGVSAAPNPNNGTTGINSSTPAVRVSATFADALANISAGEGFIDTVGTDGTGFIFIATDGVFNSPTEVGRVDIPLTTINALSEGNHTIYAHGKDAAGNWGTTSSTILVIDKTAPTISSVTLTPNTILPGAASVTLNVAASDGTGTGLNGGQYWIDGSATPPATPTAFAGTSATIDTSALAAGTHIVYVRMQDAALNWSAVSNATLYVVLAVDDTRTITANGNATQTSDANAAAGVLTNDEPVGVPGRSAAIASAPFRPSVHATGTITRTCPAALCTPATPSISGNTVCTNGAYRVTLNGVGNNNNQRAASKRGTYQFTYTLTLNGVNSTATVTITVN